MTSKRFSTTLPEPSLLTFGDGDPRIPVDVQAAHDAAVAAGLRTYIDPRTGGTVVTRLNLLSMGYCCGNGCRHCPYPAEQQRGSGRPLIRP